MGTVAAPPSPPSIIPTTPPVVARVEAATAKPPDAPTAPRSTGAPAPVIKVAAPTAPLSAAHSATPPVAANRRPPTPPVPAEKHFTFSMEEMIGTNWLPKLGVTIMFIGLVSWIAAQWQSIPAAGRIGLFYLLGSAMLGAGVWLEKRERYLVLGRSLIGGGWAVAFFTTYAMHHIPAAKILGSLEVDLLLMVAVAGAMVCIPCDTTVRWSRAWLSCWDSSP
ncbi:MAG: DUF2339 domain-containing protein [Terriglobales bacterium]